MSNTKLFLFKLILLVGLPLSLSALGERRFEDGPKFSADEKAVAEETRLKILGKSLLAGTPIPDFSVAISNVDLDAAFYPAVFMRIKLASGKELATEREIQPYYHYHWFSVKPMYESYFYVAAGKLYEDAGKPTAGTYSFALDFAVEYADSKPYRNGVKTRDLAELIKDMKKNHFFELDFPKVSSAKLKVEMK